MRAPTKVLQVLLLALTFLLVSGQTGYAQTELPRYFSETGHYLEGTFQTFYEELEDLAVRVYGYPVTDAFIDPVTDRLVQYFSYARFELTENGDVELTNVGEIMMNEQPGTSFPIVTNAQNCSTYGDAPFLVCYAFRYQFEELGGVAQFGLPISGVVQLESGRIVQYFEKGRLEYYPEARTLDQLVKPAQLGLYYFIVKGESPERLNRQPLVAGFETAAVPQSPMTVNVFPLRATLPVGEAQEVIVIVRDQNLEPVEGADIAITLVVGGQEQFFGLAGTNGQGIANGLLEFNAANADIGMVMMEVTVTHPDHSDEITKTSFRLIP